MPPEACEKLTGAVGSTDTQDICLDTGHIGIYVSSKCQKEFAPKISEWLSARNKEIKKKSAPKVTAAVKPTKKTAPGKTSAKKIVSKKPSVVKKARSVATN